MVVYDPRNMEWDYWCALMAELFAANQLGTLPEEKWEEWAAGLSGIGYFTRSGVPDYRNFATWQDWAMALTNAMTLRA